MDCGYYHFHLLFLVDEQFSGYMPHDKKKMLIFVITGVTSV